MIKLTCAVCGGTFYGNRKNTLTCSESCRRKRQADIREENQKLQQLQTKRISRLGELNKEARERGMTYGKYMAEKYASQVKVEI